MPISPMMQQYLDIKQNYTDALLLFRLGDFYEMFYDDAITASRELDLVLTGRDCGLDQRAPMCGIPYHAVDNYIPRLIEKGYKVAICEQTSQPGQQKGIVTREISRIITPGTTLYSDALDKSSNNYIASVFLHDNKAGIVWMDITTGEFNHSYIEPPIGIKINEILSRIQPAEIICNVEMLAESINLSIVKFGGVCPFSAYNETAFDFENARIAVYDNLNKNEIKNLNRKEEVICAAGALFSYIQETQKKNATISTVECDDNQQIVVMDTNARKTLELIECSNDKKKGSLIWVIDQTKTAMGSRTLKKWMLTPSTNEKEINHRLDMVEFFYNDKIMRDIISKKLADIFDIERIVGRVSYGFVEPQRLRSLGLSLKLLPEISDLLKKGNEALFSEIVQQIKNFDELSDRILKAIKPDNLPSHLREGGVIAKGYDSKFDEYLSLTENADNYISALTAREREETGIKSLKIDYNRIFGYFIEIPKSQVGSVPYRYVRKQTLANAERYITEELQEIQDKILHAKELLIERENYLYDELLDLVRARISDIFASAKAIAKIDCLISLSTVAERYNYTRPIINSSVSHIKIVEGRHPIVERTIKEVFVPNDTLLDDNENRIMLITGPNMSGKSVYMKQVALICLMAHMGSFVPAKFAEISILDNIFTRVGASDDMATGRSTFMVEMSEVAYIMENATDKSLILLDEVGRGTSTYDGFSIAYALLEYMLANMKTKTLFSTHYHELTELEGSLKGIKNYKTTVREVGNSIIFMRKLMRGGANKSFGVEVAALSGINEEIVNKAKEILKKLENLDIARQTAMAKVQQLSFFNNSKRNEIISILKDIDTNNISPRQALDILVDLTEKAASDEH